MLSSTPGYITSHMRDRTPGADSFDHARHRHDLGAKHGRERRARISQYVVTVYHALVRS